MARLEHLNITVSDPQKTAAMLLELFDWKIRWEGPVMDGAGYTIHIGTQDGYVALYSGNDPAQTIPKASASHQMRGGLNHLGVEVEDLDAVAARVKKLGLEAYGHADYAPGKRFYFHDADGIEYEVVSYR